MALFISMKELEELINKFKQVDPEKLKENIARYIRKSKYNRDSQALADVMGVNLNTIYNYRQPNRTKGISFESLVKLCNILEISLDDILR